MPVVPTTTWTARSRQSIALSNTVSGIEKSTTASGCAASSASSRVVPSAGSARAASSMSCAPSTAAQTVCPIRPPAPETTTRIKPVLLRRDADGLERLAEAALVAADRGGRHLRRRVELARELQKLVRIDGVEALDRLVQREQRRVHQERAAKAVHTACRRLHRERQPALDMLAGAAELVRADRVGADPRQLGPDHLERLGDVVLARADVDPDLAGVRVLARPRVDRVCQAPLLPDLLEQAR